MDKVWLTSYHFGPTHLSRARSASSNNELLEIFTVFEQLEYLLLPVHCLPERSHTHGWEGELARVSHWVDVKTKDLPGSFTCGQVPEVKSSVYTVHIGKTEAM